MVYNVIGVTSGSSADGLDMVFTSLTEVRGKWQYEIKAAERKGYTEDWKEKLSNAANLPAREYFLLHSEFGHFIGQAVKDFIASHGLDHQVHFITTHGHTVFHMPSQKMTAQLGDGAAIAAVTALPVISDLRAMDVALGGKGAPLFPVAEQLLFPHAPYKVNLGENATISATKGTELVAFDICPCNYVLDSLAETLGRAYDEEGKLAAGGVTDQKLLDALNGLAYYGQAYPKTLTNKFGTGTILPLIQGTQLSTQGKLNTYTKHIAAQIAKAIQTIGGEPGEVMITGGGAHNTYLIDSIKELGIAVKATDEQTLTFRNPLLIALLGALRWRQESNALASVTGADRDSIGGALWAI